MKTQSPAALNSRAGLLLLSFLIALPCLASSALAQEKSSQSLPEQSGEQRGNLIFKVPKGFIASVFPDHKTGKVLYETERPAGMFIVYLEEGKTTEKLSEQLKALVANMFYHSSDIKLEWSAAALPAHPELGNEAGVLSTTSNAMMQVQLALYPLTIAQKKVVYGYFAMQHTDKKRKDDGRFLNSTGGGVGDFDKFWKSIIPDK